MAGNFARAIHLVGAGVSARAGHVDHFSYDVSSTARTRVRKKEEPLLLGTVLGTVKDLLRTDLPPRLRTDAAIASQRTVTLIIAEHSHRKLASDRGAEFCLLRTWDQIMATRK